MKLTLSSEYRMNHILCSTALLFFLLLTFPFILILALGLFEVIRYHGSLFSQTMERGLTGIICCDAGIRVSLRRRAFLLNFGRWQEMDVSDDVAERRHLVSMARDLFMDGGYAKAAKLLERYLEQRPSDNASRLNLANCLVLDGHIDQALPLIELAGDSRKQLRWLRQEEGKLRYFSIVQPMNDLQVAKARKVWPLLWQFSILFVVAGWFLVAEINADQTQLDKSQWTGLHESDFKRVETENIIYFYHDEQLISQVEEIAERALDYDLKFLNLPANQFSARKIRFFLCSSKEEYLLHSAYSKRWEGGVAYPSEGIFYTYVEQGKLDSYFLNVVAHELCHICYYQTNSKLSQDSWLNEGLASYQGYNFEYETLNAPVAAALKEQAFRGIADHPLPFEIFLHDRPQSLSSVADVDKFYMQGLSMVYVLIRFYGKDPFLKFVHTFGMTQDMNQALSASYDSIHSLDDLYGVWSLFMKTGYN